ncbi:MAG: hypothetical protein PHN75_19120, partial [Syntrophales bacterium]|nr:hypothetical protein [Syntrophales bacterium]
MPTKSKQDGRRTLLICIVLIAVTLAVYIQVKDHSFIDFDDAEYITENPHVRTGLTKENIIWAFTEAHSNNWHPLTWISHMIDVELFGLRPAGHHLINVFIHAVNAVLLFLLLLRMTAMPWRSAFVAALFALHPLHVESVAWAAERKDVLSTLFFLITIRMYVGYVEKRDWVSYGAVLIFFSLGLMAKQMLVTLPAVLLLLDIWPLKRLRIDRPAGSGHDAAGSKRIRTRTKEQVPITANNIMFHTRHPWQGLVIEKLPLLILALLAGITVFLVQLKSGVLHNLNPFP